MKRKWFELVGDDGTALTPATAVFVGVEDVDAFQDAVKDKFKDSHLAGIAPTDLKVFANRKMLMGRDSLADVDENTTLIVQAPKQAPKQPQAIFTIDVPRVDWNIAPEPCPRLLVKDDDQMIELPSSCVVGTGIRHSNQALILYRRPPLVEQWKTMNKCSIQAYALLWIIGPPGTGKSCAAFAFTCALDRELWEVLWIHFSRAEKLLNCVWFHGNAKAVCVIKQEAIERDLPAILNGLSQERQAIVFLDGYVKSCVVGETVRLKCQRWHQEDKIKNRLVCICSMVFLKEFRASDYPAIPTSVTYRRRSSPSADTEIQKTAHSDDIEMHLIEEDEEVDSQMMFNLDSWRFEEYVDAISNTAFFNRVVNMFPPSKNALEERVNLLKEKYFVAGGSARLMFEFSTKKAIRILDDAINAATDVEKYLQGRIGDGSAAAVNLLLARYPSSSGPDIRLVSSYVARKMAVIMGPRLLENFAKACAVNPSMDGHIFEAWFFAELSHKGLDWSYRAESTFICGQWEQSDVDFFDPDKYNVSVCLDKPTWMAPSKWNQGGYDAVFVNKIENLVRFVQVTSAQKHAFDPNYFVALLNKLAAGALNKVAVVELCFVVPMGMLDEFLLPVSTADFERTVVQVASSEPRVTRNCVDQTFKNCKGNVMVIGVQYKSTNCKDPEFELMLQHDELVSNEGSTWERFFSMLRGVGGYARHKQEATAGLPHAPPT